MKQVTIPVNGPMNIQVNNVRGDLQVIGWERSEIAVKTDASELVYQVEGETLRVDSDSDLILYVARDVSLNIVSVGGDVDIRAVQQKVEISQIGGDLQGRNVASVSVISIGGDMSLRGCAGDLSVTNVGGDASLNQVKGVIKISTGADLYIRGAEGQIEANTGSDAALYLDPIPGMVAIVGAAGNILLRLPADVNAELMLNGCDDESIRVDLPGVNPTELGMSRHLVLGDGSAKITLTASGEVIVTSRAEEWEHVAEFDRLGRDMHFSSVDFPGLPPDFEEDIQRQVEEATRRVMPPHMQKDVQRRVEEATRRAMEASVRAQEKSERIQHKVDAAMRRAEEKMRSAERRTMHMGIKLGRFGEGFGSRPPVPPVPPVPPAEPVTEQERLTILKMLQEKKISIQDAEKLLAALEGK